MYQKDNEEVHISLEDYRYIYYIMRIERFGLFWDSLWG